MVNFRLTNFEKDNWLPDEFVKIDTYSEKQLERIALIIDWGGKNAKVSTLPAYQSCVPNDMYGASKTFLLPLTTDASKFPAYYDEHVAPLLQGMREYFVSGFVGADRIGYFDFEEPIEERGRKEFEYYVTIQQLLNECPRHSERFYWSLAEAHPDPNNLFLKLESCGINLAEISIHPVKTVPGIREILEEDCTYLMDDEAFAYELLSAQRAVDFETRKPVAAKTRVKATRSRKIDRFIGDSETVDHLNRTFSGV